MLPGEACPCQGGVRKPSNFGIPRADAARLALEGPRTVDSDDSRRRNYSQDREPRETHGDCRLGKYVVCPGGTHGLRAGRRRSPVGDLARGKNKVPTPTVQSPSGSVRGRRRSPAPRATRRATRLPLGAPSSSPCAPVPSPPCDPHRCLAPTPRPPRKAARRVVKGIRYDRPDRSVAP